MAGSRQVGKPGHCTILQLSGVSISAAPRHSQLWGLLIPTLVPSSVANIERVGTAHPLLQDWKGMEISCLQIWKPELMRQLVGQSVPLAVALLSSGDRRKQLDALTRGSLEDMAYGLLLVIDVERD